MSTMEVAENPFAQIPKWLEAFAQENSGLLGQVHDLALRRQKEKKNEMPWTVYLESIAVGRGFAIEKVVAFISRFHNYQIVPLNINLIEPKDYSEYFPNEILETYYAMPISLNETFLNIALLEPEVARKVSEAYYDWIGERRLKALQFFITTPTAFTQAHGILMRIQSRNR